MLHLEESADLSSQYIGTIGTSVQTKNICYHRENICSGLPSSGQEYPSGHMCTVSGWGTTSEGGALARILQKVEKIFANNKKNICFHPKIFQVDVPVVSDDDCRDSYGQNDIADSMICAGLDAGGKDSCQVKLFLE